MPLLFAGVSLSRCFSLVPGAGGAHCRRLCFLGVVVCVGPSGFRFCCALSWRLFAVPFARSLSWCLFSCAALWRVLSFGPVWAWSRGPSCSRCFPFGSVLFVARSLVGCPFSVCLRVSPPGGSPALLRGLVRLWAPVLWGSLLGALACSLFCFCPLDSFAGCVGCVGLGAGLWVHVAPRGFPLWVPGPGFGCPGRRAWVLWPLRACFCLAGSGVLLVCGLCVLSLCWGPWCFSVFFFFFLLLLCVFCLWWFFFCYHSPSFLRW